MPEREGDAFDWASAMDATRSRWRNDTPWGGRPCRTYKHYVLSPDPKDSVNLDALRELTVAWVREHFGDREVAIVCHDENAGHVPHAHVVANNANIVTGRRLQDPDSKELKLPLQRMAHERGSESALVRMSRMSANHGPHSSFAELEASMQTAAK